MAKPNIKIVLPTGVDMILLAHENITANLLRDRTSDLQLPSLYRRAYMIVNETSEVAIVESTGNKDA